MITYMTNGLAEFYANEKFKSCHGQGQFVAVLDSGIDLDHPHFGKDENKDGMSDDIAKGEDFTLDKDNTVQDKRGHGTQVAGIIKSIARDVKTIPIQITSNKGTSDTMGLEQGLQHVLDNIRNYRYLTCVNVSMTDLGNYQDNFVDSGTDNEALSTLPVAHFFKLREMGIVVTASAGNYFKFWNEKGYPTGLGAYAALKHNLGVMATDSNGVIVSSKIADFSQRRDDAIGAPGNKIQLIKLNNPDKTSLGKGTSYASAFLSGCIVLLQSVALRYKKTTLSPDAIEALIFDTSRDLGEYREIDVYKAANAILGK